MVKNYRAVILNHFLEFGGEAYGYELMKKYGGACSGFSVFLNELVLKGVLKKREDHQEVRHRTMFSLCSGISKDELIDKSGVNSTDLRIANSQIFCNI